MQLRLGKGQKFTSAVSKSETAEFYFIPPRTTINVITYVKLLQVKLTASTYSTVRNIFFMMVRHATAQKFWTIESSWEIVKNNFRKKKNFNYRSRNVELKFGLLTETISFSACLSAFNQQSNTKRSYKILATGLFGLK